MSETDVTSRLGSSEGGFVTLLPTHRLLSPSHCWTFGDADSCSVQQTHSGGIKAAAGKNEKGQRSAPLTNTFISQCCTVQTSFQLAAISKDKLAAAPFCMNVFLWPVRLQWLFKWFK